jgi:isopentenyl diphosphate isomerase/L-lactate dehydrogenase-like FMN-dependent dehydrogenase
LFGPAWGWYGATVEASSQVPVPIAGAGRFTTLAEIYAEARASLDDGAWTFLDAGAGDEVTLAENRAAFARWQFRPRLFSGHGSPDLRTSFAAIPLSMPVLTAPFGADGLLHPDGQVAVARANERAGTASIVPEACSFSLEEIARASPSAARIFQLHPVGSLDGRLRLAARAARAGYSALCVTGDCYPIGIRDRLLRARFAPALALVAGNYPDGPDELLAQTRFDQPAWSWDDLARFCTAAELPVLVKGVLTAEDARAARDVGARGVIVSNHGGRQLDGVPGALEQLPEVVEAVGGELETAFDSGIRSGTDIVKALALGADVAVLGRAAAMGLAAGGEEGVLAVLELVRRELTTIVALLGRGSAGELDTSVLSRTSGPDEPGANTAR